MGYEIGVRSTIFKKHFRLIDPMCGITGFYGFEDKALLRKMTALLSHRGPDQHNYYIDGKVSLGHRRLSIIDLSKDGIQPMSNEDESIWIVFNGEIYNYLELKRDLLRKGHTFKSKSDTEVIIHAYEEYGEKCVSLLNGDFAFAIYDSRDKSLFLARDRMGVKPLYYSLAGEHFYFASEIKAILASAEISRTVNKEALNYYLSFYCNPLPETMFKGIYKLEPGHTLKFKNGKIKITSYWDLAMKPKSLDTLPVTELRDLLSDSVQKRLMSEVPLGVYLSGGVDSGSVVGLMKPFSDKIKTFSVGFEEDPGKSELARARMTSDYFGTDHQEILINASAIKELPKIVWHLDEPMGDPTSIPTYFLSREAKKKCTVILTGEGADEQFAGYEQEKFMQLHQKYVRKVPLALRKSLAMPLKNIPVAALNPFFKYMESLGDEGKRRMLEFVLTNDNASALMSMISIFSDEEKQKVLGSSSSVTDDVRKKFFSSFEDLLNQCLLFENKILLTENLLMKVDKTTMAHGIEARVPYLDYRVVEFASRLPPAMKLKGLQDKYILREAMKRSLPPRRSAQKKERFFVPVDHWLKGELSSLSSDLLSRDAVKEYFDPLYVEKMFSEYNRSPLFYGRQIWTLLNFQMWHKMFVEGEKVRV